MYVFFYFCTAGREYVRETVLKFLTLIMTIFLAFILAIKSETVYTVDVTLTVLLTVFRTGAIFIHGKHLPC